jgi:hypothetical protein
LGSHTYSYREALKGQGPSWARSEWRHHLRRWQFGTAWILKFWLKIKDLWSCINIAACSERCLSPKGCVSSNTTTGLHVPFTCECFGLGSWSCSMSCGMDDRVNTWGPWLEGAVDTENIWSSVVSLRARWGPLTSHFVPFLALLAGYWSYV